MKDKTKKELGDIISDLTQIQIQQIVALGNLEGGYVDEEDLRKLVRRYELIAIKKKRKAVIKKLLEENE